MYTHTHISKTVDTQLTAGFYKTFLQLTTLNIFHLCLRFFFWQCWGLNSGTRACQAGALLLTDIECLKARS
jgi:hypothetical protein